MKIGLQLYSVRDVAAINYADMMRQVAAIGYDAVEPAGFFGTPAEEFKSLLEETGMEIWGTHTGLKLLEEDFAGTVAYHKTIGCRELIIPHAVHSTAEELEHLVEQINYYQPRLAAEGIRLHYHNHSTELRPNNDGQIALDVLAEKTKVCFEFDTFWLFNAGRVAVDVMETYRDRVHLIHLKDGFAQDYSNPESRPIGASVGSGSAPVDAVRKKAEEMGIRVVVESEDLSPSGPEEVKRCMDYLRSKA